MPEDIRFEFNYIITTYLNEFFKGVERLNEKEKAILIDMFKKNKHLISVIKNSKLRKHRFEGLLLSISVPWGVKMINKLR